MNDGNAMYLRSLNEEEALRLRQESFKKLKRGSLFDLGMTRFFIAVRKVDEETWEVIELDDTNINNILIDKRRKRSRLHLSDMQALNLR